jgi:cytochrome c peroxidase
VNNLEMQALAPISHPSEMGNNLNEVVNRLNGSLKYRKLFYHAFGDSMSTGEKTLKAISQFMITLVSANSKYDKVMRNEMTFSQQEEKGYQLFQKNCVSCHAEPLFSSGSFENNGLPMDILLKDIGRMKISGSSDDSMKFKVPSLRNIEFSYPYMHDGRVKKL